MHMFSISQYIQKYIYLHNMLVLKNDAENLKNAKCEHIIHVLHFGETVNGIESLFSQSIRFLKLSTKQYMRKRIE